MIPYLTEYSAPASTALHEAGHAVTAWWWDEPIIDVSVVFDDTSLGRVRHPPAPEWFHPDMDFDPKTRDRIEHSMMVFQAGYLAERKWLECLPERPADYLEQVQDGASHDHAVVDDLASYATDTIEELEAYLHWLTVRTRGVLTMHWHRVLALSSTLLERREMTGREVLDVLRQPSR